MRIENLRPSTSYIFRIRAKNEVGFGNYKEFTHTTVDIREFNVLFVYLYALTLRILAMHETKNIQNPWYS